MVSDPWSPAVGYGAGYSNYMTGGLNRVLLVLYSVYLLLISIRSCSISFGFNDEKEL
jgi:hypothetical protein